MSKIYSLAELQSILNPVFSEHGVRKAVIFGSYAKGTATVHSDVDLLDVTQIEHGSKVEHEIQNSGVAIYGQ